MLYRMHTIVYSNVRFSDKVLYPVINFYLLLLYLVKTQPGFTLIRHFLFYGKGRRLGFMRDRSNMHYQVSNASTVSHFGCSRRGKNSRLFAKAYWICSTTHFLMFLQLPEALTKIIKVSQSFLF